MRVISGRLGGRQLLAPKGWSVRPTSERVREALFSALGDVTGYRVADLYCGTGALGIEALSRGATSAVFVDSDTRPVMGNVHNLGLVEESELVRGGAGDWLASVAGRQLFDLILIDPPYRVTEEIGEALNRDLPGLLTPGGRVVVESAAKQPLVLPSLEAVRERRYGRTLITFFEVPSYEKRS
ncbi:MAG: 16S rRNA (guanine(966)-N(2))-methyltransferase RsmD [Thermoleophilia bacterium]|nr:16S rRNA (guanine(966)-N(2))-methyltransferase RsmD [Thermoleophilia bacterium]